MPVEAAALGRPIITTNTPGCRDVVSPNNGILISQDYNQSLTKAFNDILLLSFNDLKKWAKRLDCIQHFLMKTLY